ncbi:NDR1/HIN1-like protein 1 [Dioscorea cayenensis subsp. rotundata]|uniref:NDR1/HIN1-like protein 1 n=1 Tax=Dioscorea cayennensis subsp. rotundata TaxID=55577 RepID=A0AB40ATB7_DIOCR|nr:NDR1/HIN1-like protein 1 [Dioscorea cayenensis subsp. rotundata]
MPTTKDFNRIKLDGRICACLVGFVFIILLTILIIYLILHPTHPMFFLQSSSINQLSLSTTSTNFTLLTTSLQVSISSYNPNNHIGIYYHNLHAYTTYRGQQITLPTSLPGGYQGHHESLVWSPFLYGTNVPLLDLLGRSMDEDKHAGLILLQVIIDGKVRWRVGSWLSNYYHITANCPAFFFIDSSKHQLSFMFEHATSCKVDV